MLKNKDLSTLHIPTKSEPGFRKVNIPPTKLGTLASRLDSFGHKSSSHQRRPEHIISAIPQKGRG